MEEPARIAIAAREATLDEVAADSYIFSSCWTDWTRFRRFLTFPEGMTLAAVKTYMARPSLVQEKWWIVDATDKIVGRLASDIAVVLMGKHRPTYTPHVDNGDYVIVTNCEKIKFTGQKLDKKRYAWYTGYTRQRTESAKERLAENPEQILREAVRRMLPKNKLSRKMLMKLKLQIGPNHPHQAQSPELRDMGTN